MLVRWSSGLPTSNARDCCCCCYDAKKKKYYVAGPPSEMFTFLKSSKCPCKQSPNNWFLLCTDYMMHYKDLRKIMKQVNLQSSSKEYFELSRFSKPLKYFSVATHMYLFSIIWRMWGEEKVTRMFYMNSDDSFLHLQLSHTNILLIAW